MPYRQPQRNFNNRIRNARTRLLWDAYWNEADDALSEAYYDSWRHGNPFEVVLGDGVPFKSVVNIDPTWTPAEIKQFWDDLQKELHHCYYQGFEFWNNTGQPADRIPESEWNDIMKVDPNNPDAPPVFQGKRTDLATTTLNEMELAGTRRLKSYFSKWS